jgi:hypothetical protein
MPDANGPAASPVRPVGSIDALRAELEAFAGSRAILLVGGADFTDEALLDAIRGFLSNLASWCDVTRTAVVDGGTDSGVMRLVGEARHSLGGTFPLIGVAPAGALDRSASSGSPIDPARGHSVVLLTPGDRFGDETALLFAAADLLGAGHAPTVVVNGGRLSMDEANQRLQQGEVVIAVEGSGRSADELAARATGNGAGRATPQGLLRRVPIDARPEEIAGALDEAIERPTSA